VLVKLEGDQCQDFFFMLSGEIRIYKVGGSSREITLYEIGPGDICVLNASCILSNTKLPANAATTSETEVLLLSSQRFLDMIAGYEEMRAFVHSRINERMSSIMTLVSEISFGKMNERLIDYLIEKSENNNLKRTHQHIAQDLGTSREVVSRLLKDFERQGLVLLSRNFIQLKGL
jgi:CRP/FNR family transcriptional regulator